MRILFVSDFFPPETNAAASRVYERARYWVEWGHEVTVLTSAPNFPMGEVYAGYRNRWIQEERIDGIRVVRIKTYMARNQGRWRRGLDFVSFLVTAFPVGLLLGRPDVVAATSPNFFAGLAGCFIAICRRKPFVLEIGDLWPAFVQTLGAIRQSLVLKVLEGIELFMYRRADRIICLSHGFRENLESRGVPGEKISVILNGAELGMFSPGPPDPEDVERFNPGRRFTVGYYGTQGAAHGLLSVIEAAKELPDIHFLFVGGGADAELLRERVQALGLENVSLVPPQERSLMPRLWRLCDVALVQLRDLPLLNSAIPSKLFEAMASARPVLLAAPEGDASRIVRQEECGLHVPSGDVPALVDAIRTLAESDDQYAEMSQRAQAASAHYSRKSQAELVLDVLADAFADQTGSAKPCLIPFSQRIKDRNQRWWNDGGAFEFKNVGRKLEGRQYAEEMGCRVPVLYALVNSAEEIPDFDELPDRFVIKPSRGSSAKNVFAMDGGVNLLDDRRWTRQEVVDALDSTAAQHRGSRKMQYLVEEFLTNWDGKPGIPLDYKFYVFGERIAFIHVIERNSGANLRQNRHWYLTETWEPLGRQIVRTQIPETSLLPAPDCLAELIDIVRVMGKRLNMFLRIDMYVTDQGPVLGEFTPQPHGGKGYTAAADEWLGAMWEGIEGAGD